MSFPIYKYRIFKKILSLRLILSLNPFNESKRNLKDEIKDILQDLPSIEDENERQSREDQLKILLDAINVISTDEDVQDIQTQLDEILQEIETAETTKQEYPFGYQPPQSDVPLGPQKSPGKGMHPQDDSTQKIMDCVRAGYTHCIWQLHESHPRTDICDTLYGTVFKLEDMVLNLQHNAPIFEKSHPGCGCWLLVYSEYDGDLPWVILDYGGRFA